MIRYKPTLWSLALFAGVFALRAVDPSGSSPASAPSSAPAAAPAMAPMPQPGPEHELLKKWSGVWDVSAKMYMPGMAGAMSSTGVWTCKMLGGFWSLCDLQSEMMGQPFLGHQVQGYDLHRKKITATWLDTSADWMETMTGTASADGKTVTLWGQGYNMAGKMTSHKSVGSWFDDDHYAWKMWEMPKGKKPVLIVEITYVRRK
jgi:hypothetical protein